MDPEDDNELSPAAVISEIEDPIIDREEALHNINMDSNSVNENATSNSSSAVGEIQELPTMAIQSNVEGT